MYCQFLGHPGIASFFRAPSTPSFLMRFGIWLPNMIIFVLVHSLRGGGCLVQKVSGNDSQSELMLPGRSEKSSIVYVTSITHILQSIRLNFTNFLPHVFIQV